MFKRLIAPVMTALAIAATAAFAHATVRTDMGTKESKVGAFESYRLQVPTEKPMDTVEVKLMVPAGLTVSNFGIVPGFERSVEKDAAGVITSVTWKGKIGQQEFARFPFSARNPAKAGRLWFKAYQKYADGSVVAWDVEDEKAQTPASFVDIKE